MFLPSCDLGVMQPGEVHHFGFHLLCRLPPFPVRVGQELPRLHLAFRPQVDVRGRDRGGLVPVVAERFKPVILLPLLELTGTDFALRSFD